VALPKQVKQRAIELSRLHSPAKVIEALLEEFPAQDIPLNEKTIRRWNKDENKQHIESRKKHFEHLLSMVNFLLGNDVGKVFGNPSEGDIPEVDDYTIISEASDFERIPHSRLVERIENNIEDICKTYSVYDFWDCFVPHLLDEVPSRQGFERLYNNHTIDFINTLRMLTQRKTFKGTCPVCEDWQ